MSDLISRQAAIEALEGEITVTGRANADAVREYAKLICDRIKRLPTIDPVKHGKWIKNEGRFGWHCSVCREDDLYAFSWNCDKGEKELQDRYCPNCGARMDGEKE